MDLRVLDGNGQGLTSNVIRALDYCVQKKASLGIRVINMSLGHPVFESYQTDPLCQAVERCVKAGIVVVVAAGNFGKGESAAPFGAASPARPTTRCHYRRRHRHQGTVGRGDDTIASYSSRGPRPSTA